MVTPHVLDWLERNGKKDNWMMHVHYGILIPLIVHRQIIRESLRIRRFRMTGSTRRLFEEHLLHRTCANEINMWNDDTFPQWPKALGKLTTLEEAKHLLDLYDDGVKYTDDNIGQIIGWLKDNGLCDDDLAIII